MIHEHEALELASAAIDFGLGPEVERELTLTYRDCPVCAERAASYHEQIRMMRRLPVLDASEATRQRVTAAALGGRAGGRSTLVLVLAAALLVALLLGLTAAAGALLRNRPPEDLLGVGPSPSGATTSPPGSAAPGSQDPVTAGGGVFADKLPADSIAQVVETNVRVRSEPRVSADSTKLEPFLQPGDRLFVVEGPVVADDYDWYRVVPIGTDPGRPGASLPTGWVSRGDHDATPWIEPSSADCPRAPVDIARLGEMHPLERLACFGSSPLSYWAIVEGGPDNGWAAETSVGATVEAPVQGLEVKLRPSPTTPDLPHRRATLLRGTFDDPGCRVNGGEDVVDALDCRTAFVVTDAAVDPADLQAGAVALTTTDNLRVRAQPTVDDSSEKFELLPAGTRLGVIGGPAVGSGYVWYRVAVPSIRDQAGHPRVGWVAAHSTDGEPWVGLDALECAPAGEVSLEQLSELTSPPTFHGGVSCYGRDGTIPAAELTVDAHVRRACAEPVGTPSSWLLDPRREVVLSMVDVDVEAILADGVSTSSACGAPASSLLYRVTGHFDDGAADDCRSAAAEPSRPDPVATYECRMRFVVSSIVVGGPRASRAPGAP